MKLLASICCIQFLLLGAAVAEEPSTTTTAPAATAPAPSGPVPQETVVLGTPPADLEGRWLVVHWIGLTEANSIGTDVKPWEITRHDGKLELKVRFAKLPPDLQQAVDQANNQHVPWKPSPEDLARVRAAWDELPEYDVHAAKISSELSGRDGFPGELQRGENTKDAIWVVRQRYDMDAAAAPMIRQVQVYAALKPSDGGYTGNLDAVSLAAVPFPVPLQFKGTFEIYPLDEHKAVPRGFLARLFDSLAGCAGRPK